MLRIIYFGQRYYCPMCKSWTRTQLLLGSNHPVISEKQIVGAGRRRVICPICGSSDRLRLLYLFLKTKTDLFTRKHKLLHLAPEATLKEIFEPLANIDYLTADLYRTDVMENMDITQIPYPDNTFDAIICCHVLEHIPDDTGAMKELGRVLKSNGWIVLQVPISKIIDNTFEDARIVSRKAREQLFGQKDHVRIYGKDYVDRLEGAGFNMLRYRWIVERDEAFINPQLNLNADETVFFGIKRAEFPNTLIYEPIRK